MSSTLQLNRCPTCGSAKIRRVCMDVKGEFRGKPYVASRVAFHECPACGERVFDREAMRRIEDKSPAFPRQKKAPRRRPA
ncbi:MAG: type II toxin-antitoxin system MqsA family antitoxin [Planctomycetes bacterium]|nr:type II toxin-antitoxin system MqsA family antitoxin [Planctomycetota bacterium]